ncbi:MAG: N-acetylglucosamine-6-phosphate deacetylase [Planctomycetes bacterium]|nr:N-acetylglucosamine-6-phosphate deacetylase [Planctomycetota bacterium]
MTPIEGYLLTPQGFVAGRLTFSGDGRISEVAGAPVETARVRDGARPLLLPGFIDLHVHGGGGHDFMEGAAAAARVTELHARHGTTALLATTLSAPPAELAAAFSGLRAVCRERSPRGARALGVHLEGPFINPAKLGAQPDHVRPLDLAELQRLHALAPIRVVTLSPEVRENREAIPALRAAGIQVQIGHSLGSYEEGVAALERGATGFTHLFNALSGLHHRTPGMVGAALAHARFAEIIPDLLHVHPGAIRAALRAIPQLYCVTDATAAAGMPDGPYRWGPHTVTKHAGGVRLADGTLAGSTLTMDQALRNLVDALGLDLADAARRVSTFAADYLGEKDRGRLAPGAWGDAVLLDRDLTIRDVFIQGVSLDHRDA